MYASDSIASYRSMVLILFVSAVGQLVVEVASDFAQLALPEAVVRCGALAATQVAAAAALVAVCAEVLRL